MTELQIRHFMKTRTAILNHWMVVLCIFSVSEINADGIKIGPPKKIGGGGDKIQTDGDESDSTRRKMRNPLGGHPDNGETPEKSNPDDGKPRKPKTGMGEDPNKGKRPSIISILQLSPEAAESFKKIMGAFHKRINSIVKNDQLQLEQKIKLLQKAHHEKVEALKEILTEKQFSRLRAFWNFHNGPKKDSHDKKHHHPHLLVKLLDLTPEQTKKLHAARHYAFAKSRKIATDPNLSDEVKKEELKKIREQLHRRRLEILTDEQKELLADIREIIKNNRDHSKEG